MRLYAALAFSLFLATVGVAGPVRSADILVDNVRGDDGRDGGSKRLGERPTGPVRTIRRALELALAGDRILLTKNDEPYHESVTLQGGRHSGIPLVPFEIDGQGAVLDGTAEAPPEIWSYVARDIFRFDPLIRSHGVLFVDGRLPAGPGRAGGRRTTRPEALALEPGQAALAEGQVWFRTQDGRLPGSYDLRWSVHTVGITLYEVRSVVIRNLTVQGFAMDGINLHDGATQIRLEGVALQGNGRSGLHVGGASRATLASSLVEYNLQSQIHLEGAARLHLQANNLSEQTAPALQVDGGQVTGDLPASATAREARADLIDPRRSPH